MTTAQKEQILEWAQIIIDRFQVETSSGPKNTYLVDIQYNNQLQKLIIYHTDLRITIRHRYKCYLCKNDKIMPCCIAVHIYLNSNNQLQKLDVYDCRCLADDNDIYGTVWEVSRIIDLQDKADDFTNAISLLVYILEPVVQATEFEMGEYITV